MTRLPDHFKSGGFQFHQICREGDVALFEKSKSGGAPSFEVVRIQRRKERRAFGKVMPAGEAMPPPESWGRRGWSFASIESGKDKFCELQAPPGCPFSPIPIPAKRFLGRGRAKGASDRLCSIWHQHAGASHG